MIYKKIGKNKYRKKNWFERHETITYMLYGLSFLLAILIW